MDFLSLLYLGIATLILYIFWRKYTRRQFPPGPRGVPLFGNMFQIDQKYPNHTLSEWAREYGDIYSISLLGQDKVVVSGEDLIREASVTNTDAFSNRPFSLRINDMFLNHALTISNSPVSDRWVKVKKAVMTSLKAYGPGLERIEKLTLEAAEEMLEKIKSNGQKAFDPQDLFQETFVKIVHTMLVGCKPSQEDAGKLVHLEREIIRLVVMGGNGTELEVLPWLRYFKQTYVRELENVNEGYRQVMLPAIDARKSQSEKNECVVDALLRYNKKAEREEDKLSELDLIFAVNDVGVAGMTTSSSALYSLIALCVNHPHIAQRIQAEIDDVIGSRVPRLDDRNSMPYVNAAMLELLRIISHVPLSLPHETTREVTIGGYTLPKGQEVWLNLWSLHHDDRYWEDPWVFKAERFLTSDGELVPTDHINRRRLMVFGAGRRVCLGENMAKSRLFIIICLLFQQYDFLPEDEKKRPLSDPRQYTSTFVLRPQSYKIRCVPRKNKT